MLHKRTLKSNIQEFDKAYLNLRKRENRIFEINEIEHLPEVSPDHIHFTEWRKRQHSFQLFSEYVKQNNFNSLCDLACGNGWFLNKLAPSFNKIVGIEVNEFELNQANKVLEKYKNVELYLGDIFELNINDKFELITINAAIQYFDPFDKIISRMLDLLQPNGEIHILDSPFYKNKVESKLASSRSKTYYNKQGSESLNNFYHHHCIEDINVFNHQVMFNPYTFINRIKQKLKPQSPFYWIKITS